MSIEIKVPALGESVSEAGIAKLYKNVGDAVKADELLVELETDKVTLEVNAPKDGVITAINVAEGDNVVVGDLIATMKEGEAGSVTAESKSEEKTQAPTNASDQSSGTKNQYLSPAPQRIISENNLNSGSISGTGKDGRITKGDALSAINSSSSNQAPKAA
ncbi:MAG: 2-oxoglutarate dehydrogenase E2 component (dihydrolipoamide succinyltransferase), partial [Rickettsiales bacterium]